MNNYHESEVVTLIAKRECLRADLHAFLMKIGFKSVDDFYKFKRNGDLPAWQSTTLLSIDVRLRGAEVYETEEDVIEGKSGKWDVLVAEYLMATVPKECVRLAVDLLFSVCERFDLEASYCGKPQAKLELIGSLENIAADLVVAYDEPGSETLAILIEQSYRK